MIIQISAVQPLKFVDAEVISSHTFLTCDYLSMQEFDLINLDKMALHKTKWCHDMKEISACLTLCDGIHRWIPIQRAKG